VVKEMRAIFSNLEAQGYPRERQEVRHCSSMGSSSSAEQMYANCVHTAVCCKGFMATTACAALCTTGTLRFPDSHGVVVTPCVLCTR
jgi:hypothetical protein